MRLPLFFSLKERGGFFLLFLFLFFVSVGIDYRDYQRFKAHSIQTLDAKVLQQYQKSKANRTYWVLKLQSEGRIFYTTSRMDLKDLTHHHVRLKILTKKITFHEWLSRFYAPSFQLTLRPTPPHIATTLYHAIAAQHQNEMMTNLYAALFLATPLQKPLRQQITYYGIAHLTALSGYHLGLISTLLFFLLKPLYTPLHRAYLPWRNRDEDILLITLGVLFGYLLLTNVPDSLLRAFVMSLIGTFIFFRGVRVLSFETLALTVFGIILLFPGMLLSIGFWLSVSGVFYIFLLLRHLRYYTPWQQGAGITFLIYPLMLPIVHLFFPEFSLAQALSPLLTLLFTLFYPLSALLHLIGYGGLLDEILLFFLSTPKSFGALQTPLPLFIGYLALSLGAIPSERLFKALLFSALLFWVYGLSTL